jgi:hypothetical protein
MKFNIFSNKKLDSEVTTNPSILYNLKMSGEDILVHGLKLGDSSILIDQGNIWTTTFERNPFGITNLSFKDNKTYFQSGNGLIEYLLIDRIKSVLDYGGILHMKTGAKYVIRDQKIIGIGIHGAILEPYRYIRKAKIEKKFGKADSIKEIYEEIDGTLFGTDYNYNYRRMRISFDDWRKEISMINIGQFYD